jgi:hypothetical protein
VGCPSTGERCQSGRPDSNRRRPAWEAGILPLNYARGIGSECGPMTGDGQDVKPPLTALPPDRPYLDAEASKKLRKSGSLIAGSPGDTLSNRPWRIHRSNSPTRSKRWSNESTTKSSGW